MCLSFPRRPPWPSRSSALRVGTGSTARNRNQWALHTAKLDEEPVARELDHAPMMRGGRNRTRYGDRFVLRRMGKSWLPTGRGKSHCLARNIKRTDTSLLSRNYWLNRRRRLYLAFLYRLQPYSVAKRVAASNSARWLLLPHRLAAGEGARPLRWATGAPHRTPRRPHYSTHCRHPCYAVARGSESARHALMADLVALGAHGLRKAACGRWAFSSARAQMSLCLSPHHSALQFSEFGSVGEALTLPPG